MDDKKTVFVSFPKEDIRQRNVLKEHLVVIAPSFELTDFPFKDARSQDWKDRVQLRVRRSHGVMVLVSESSLTSGAQRWEISCAKLEKKSILAIWAYNNDRTSVPGLNTTVWSWDTISGFIESL